MFGGVWVDYLISSHREEGCSFPRSTANADLKNVGMIWRCAISVKRPPKNAPGVREQPFHIISPSLDTTTCTNTNERLPFATNDPLPMTNTILLCLLQDQNQLQTIKLWLHFCHTKCIEQLVTKHHNMHGETMRNAVSCQKTNLTIMTFLHFPVPNKTQQRTQ